MATEEPPGIVYRCTYCGHRGAGETTAEIEAANPDHPFVGPCPRRSDRAFHRPGTDPFQNVVRMWPSERGG